MDLLVVAATAPELAWVEPPVRALACGVGPVEAAAATAEALQARRPDAVLHVGIAGARRGEGLGLGSIVLGSAAHYSDLAARIPGLVTSVPADERLLAAARSTLPAAVVVPIATSAAVGAGLGQPVEAMEGFGVLRAAARAGVPALELRAISNEVEEADRGRWDIPGALARLDAAGRMLVAALVRA